MSNINMNYAASIGNNVLNPTAANKTAKDDKVKETEKATELTEKDKLELFKKEIWKEIDGMPWNKSMNVSIQITENAFKRMMEEPEFKKKMLSIIKEDAIAGKPPGDVTLIWINEKGYSGYAYMEGGKTAFMAHSKHKDSFYTKKAEKRKDFNKLWEEKMLESKMRQKRLNKEYYGGLLEKRQFIQKENMAKLYDRNVRTLDMKDCYVKEPIKKVDYMELWEKSKMEREWKKERLEEEYSKGILERKRASQF